MALTSQRWLYRRMKPSCSESITHLSLMFKCKQTFIFRFHLKHILNNDLDYAFLYPVNYNFSGYQHLIVPTLKNFSKVEWLEEQQGQWTEKYQVPLAHILTSRGFAFSFNIMNSNDIFRTDQYSLISIIKNIKFIFLLHFQGLKRFPVRKKFIFERCE